MFTLSAHNQLITLLPGMLSIQTPEGMEKAAELLAALPFTADAVFGELKSLLETAYLPTELFIAAAQPPTPLLPLLEQIIDKGCPVSFMAPAADVALVERGLKLPLPIVSIEAPSLASSWLED
jgi:hypothetical protein